jgi:copper chaperone CopZ
MTYFGFNNITRFFKEALVLAGSVIVLVTLAPALTNAAQTRQAVIAVKGLSCPVCAHRLEKVLGKLPGAEEAHVDLQKGQAVVDFAPNAKPTDQKIIQRVREAGFVPGKIEWHSPRKIS